MVSNLMHENYKLKSEGNIAYKPSVCENCEHLKEEINLLEK